MTRNPGRPGDSAVSFLRFSIRNQLLLLGALATGSIWAGALLQYVHLREQSSHLAQVQRDLQSAGGFSELARYAAQERGLGNGWLLRRSRAGCRSTACTTRRYGPWREAWW